MPSNKLFSKLFKPDWQHRHPGRRVRAINAFSEADPEHQKIIANIALTDTDPAVRSAAIKRLLDCQILENLILQAQASAPQERLMYLIQSTEAIHRERIAAYLQAARADTLTMVACHSPDTANRSCALSRITEQQRLFEVAVTSTFACTREGAASRVEQLDLLRQLWERVRKRDKSLARKLQERLDKSRQDELHSRQHSEQTEKIITAMQELERSVWTPQYRLRFLGLESQWEQLGSQVSAEQTSRYREAAKNVASVVQEYSRVQKAPEQQQQLLTDAETLRRDSFNLSSGELAPKMKQWQSLRQCWLDSLAVVAPDDAVRKQFARFETIFTALEHLAQMPRLADTAEPKQRIDKLEAAIANINWPASLPPPAALMTVTEDLQHYRDALRSQLAEEKAQVEAIGKQIARFRSTVRRKDLRAARGLRKKIGSRMDQSAAGQSSKLIEQLGKADQELHELVDWKEFAIRPKFLDLCEQMEALAETPQPPRQQAGTIKTLQQTWKALNALAPDAMWQRFKQAGDRAFEPCAAFYAEQDRQRAANLEHRKVIVTQLEALAELLEQPGWSENPDWKKFRSQFRKLCNNWRRHADVKHQQAHATDSRYNALIEQLEAHLQEEYVANLAHKQRLLDRANTLADAEVTSHSLNEIKALQVRWKEVGITDHKDDQKMWQAFRDACDKVFGKHKQQIDGERAEERRRVATAGKIIQAIRALAGADAGVAPDEARMNQLENEFNDLLDLPDGEQKKLERELRKAAELVQAATRKFKATETNRQLLEMQRRADICAVIEWAADKNTATIKALQQDWDLGALPAALLQTMEERRATALKKKFNTQDFQNAERERRLTCIELETLLNQDSPTEDSDLRMEYQLQLLKSRGLHRHSNQDVQHTAHELRCRWYQFPAAGKRIQSRLDERFHGLLAAFTRQ